MHTAWAHLEGKPLTEADLPRSIEAIDGNSNLAAQGGLKPKEPEGKAGAQQGGKQYDDHGHEIPAAAVECAKNLKSNADGDAVAKAFAMA